MKLIKFDTVHPKDYLRQKKERSKIQIEKFSYEEYLNWLIRLRSNYSDFFTHNLKRYGWEGTEFIINDFDLIRKAVDQIAPSKTTCNLQENEALKLHFIRDLIKAYKPDVIIVREQTGIASNFWNQFRKNALILGVMSCPMPNPWYVGDYDVLITSTPIFREFFQASGTPSYLLGNGFDERILNEVTLNGPLHDVVFVGGLGAPVFTKRTQLMEYLSRNIEFKWWGYGIEKFDDTCRLKHTWQGQSSGLDMFNIFNQAHIVLNDYGREAKGLAVNQRLYEVMGIGSFMLTRHSPNLAKDFPPGIFATFHNKNDCLDKIKYFLINENERNEIAMAGQKFVLEHFSYKKIMGELHQIISREYEKKFRKKLWSDNCNSWADLSCNKRKGHDELAEINNSRGNISGIFKASNNISVSAIVSTFNSEYFIRGCLEDLERQTIAKNLEIIVVNSGSEQNEEVIVKEFQKKYSNIKYIRTESRENVYAAWNRGIRAASGKYITNANTDDRHRADAFEIMIRALGENQTVGAVYADTLITDTENETFENNTARQYFNRPNFNLRQLLIFSSFGPQPMWRRSVHQRIGYFDEGLSVASDYDFFIRLAHEYGALHIGEILGLYTCRSSSIENSNREKCVSETLQVLRRYRNIIPLEDLYPELKSEKELEEAFAACLADQGTCCLFGDLPDIEGALTYYNRSLEHGYTEPELAANFGVALLLAGNQTEGMEILRRIADRVQSAVQNLAVIEQYAETGELPPLVRLKAAEIRHPVVLAATSGKGLLIEESRFIPVETFEKHLTGSEMVRNLPCETDRIISDESRPALVTVVVRTMNRPILLEECLTSLASQTFKDFEVVVINDGGKKIDDIIEKYSRRMRILYREHPSNRGRTAALNTGLKSARGKYIAYIDDDDRFYPEHFATLVNELEIGEFAVVYSDSFEVSQETSNGTYKTVRKRLVYSHDYDRDLLRRANYIPILNLMHHRDCVEKIGLFDENLTVLEDWDYWIRLSEHYDFKHVPRVTAEYRVRSDHSNATTAEGHHFPICREKIRAKLAASAEIPAKRAENPLVSMVILTCNQFEYTQKCLASIFEHTEPLFEIIVVDNGSVDGTPELLNSHFKGKFPADRLKVIINKENKGFAAGNNQGIAAASGEYILLMNNDIVVTQGWIDRLINCAEKNPKAGIIGPMSNYVSGPQLVEDVDYNTQTLEGLEQFSAKVAEQNTVKEQRLLRVVGFCMLIKRAVIDKIGGMDDRYGLGNFEDDDFSLRATIAGFESWIAKDCFIHHFGHRTFAGEKVDLKSSLLKNWEVFKEKWGLPSKMPYGSPYRLADMKNTWFDPSIHFYPLEKGNAIMKNPSDDYQTAEAAYCAVQANFSTKRSEEIIKAFENLVNSYPTFALAHNDLGVLYYNAGNKEKAQYHYEQAIKLMPENINFQKNLADFYCLELGRIEAALQIYVDILRSHPDDIETLMATGQICVALEKPGDAMAFFNRVLEIEPWNEDVRKAIEKLEGQPMAETINAQTPDEIYQNIKLNLNASSPEEAIEKFQKLVGSYPDFALGHNDLGVLYYNAGNKEKTFHHYQLAAQLQPENTTFRKNLADFLFVELGKVEEALEIYVNILALNPQDVETLLITGHICVALKRFDDARDFYNRVLELEPDNSDASNNLLVLAKQQTENGLFTSETSNISAMDPENMEALDFEPHRPEAENPAKTASILIDLDGIQNRVKECIKSIQAHTFESHELILINRGATKGILKWAQQLAEDNDHYHIIECGRQTDWAAAINQAIQKANGDLVVLMHNDVVVPKGWLKAFKICIGLVPNIGVVGPMSNQTSGIQQMIHSDESERVAFESAAETFNEINQYRRVSARKLSDFCLAFRRELPDKIGYFDEQFVSEEIVVEDFCNRAASAGYQNLIAADTYVHHYDRHKVKKNASIERKRRIEDRKKLKAKSNRNEVPSLNAKTLQTARLLQTATDLNEKGDINQAIEILLSGIGIQPEDDQFYLALAEILLTAKRFEDAQDALTEMPATDDTQEMRKAELLGYVEEGLGNYEASLAHIERVLSVNPTVATALNLKGILAFRNQDRNSAEQFFCRAIASDPGYGEPYTNLGILKLEEEQEEAALKLFEKGFNLTPSDFDIATNYHSLISELDDYQRAEKFVREAAALYPNNQKIRYLLIDCLVQTGKYDEAMDEIEFAIVKFGVEDGIIPAALKVREKLGAIQTKKGLKKAAVSLSMIVKNEEKYIAKCLASVKPIVDEMIVVDTGSTDRTKDIAEAFGAKTYDFEWDNDFAKARNHSISKAEGDWIFVMDADEVISPRDYDRFRKIVSKRPKAAIAYRITTRNYNKLANMIGWTPNDGQYPDEEAVSGWLPSAKVRLFYGRDLVWFEGAVHEMVDPVLKRNQIKIKQCLIPIHHYGRLNEDNVNRKDEVYFEIGKKKLENMADDINAIRELAVQATNMEKNDEALKLWNKLLSLNSNPRAVSEIHINLGTIYSRMGNYQNALEAAKKAVENAPDLKEAKYNYAVAELHAGDLNKTIAVLEDLLSKIPDYPPARFILAAAYGCAGRKETALMGLNQLKATPLAPFLVYSCAELAKGLITAQRHAYALMLLSTAIECEIINAEILNLFAECIRLREEEDISVKNSRLVSSDMQPYEPENLRQY